MRKTNKHTKKITVRRMIKDTFLCLSCGAEFSKGVFNLAIAGFYNGRREGYVCICCMLDSKRRQILEDEGYTLPSYEEVKKVLTSYKKGIANVDHDLNKQRVNRKPYEKEEE